MSMDSRARYNVTNYEYTGDPKEVIETRCAVGKSQCYTTSYPKVSKKI